MSLYSLGDKQPQLGENAWVAPNATVIGDVRLGRQRLDLVERHAARRQRSDHIGENSNIQDGSVLHTDGHAAAPSATTSPSATW